MHAPQTMTRHERLQKSVQVLTLIENCRRQTGDAHLGTAIERLIVERELRELEDGAVPAIAVRTTRINRELVIPVRKVFDH